MLLEILKDVPRDSYGVLVGLMISYAILFTLVLNPMNLSTYIVCTLVLYIQGSLIFSILGSWLLVDRIVLERWSLTMLHIELISRLSSSLSPLEVAESQNWMSRISFCSSSTPHLLWSFHWSYFCLSTVFPLKNLWHSKIQWHAWFARICKCSLQVQSWYVPSSREAVNREVCGYSNKCKINLFETRC